jgi:hypothetical protein
MASNAQVSTWIAVPRPGTGTLGTLGNIIGVSFLVAATHPSLKMKRANSEESALIVDNLLSNIIYI